MKEHPDIVFALRLRQFRLHARLTQQDLADQMTAAGYQMANSTISNIECGKRLVTVGEAVQFATAVGVPLMALLTDDLAHDSVQAHAAVPAMWPDAAPQRHGIGTHPGQGHATWR